MLLVLLGVLGEGIGVYGSFSRSFDVSGVDVDAISASYDNGVLNVKLPKKQETIPAKRSLEIQ